MMKKFKALQDLKESIKVKSLLLSHLESNEICELYVKTYLSGNKIMIAGNGGSAVDAQHFAGEMVSRFNFDRPPLGAITLTTDTSILKAIGNDYGYGKIFSRQIQAHDRFSNIFYEISTSGISENILEAISVCKKIGIHVIGFSGLSEGKMKELCEYCICDPSSLITRIQECHITIEHAICNYVERSLFSKASS